MARFLPNRPITTGEPTIVVDAGLPSGRHRFRLEVIDSAGLRSTPSDVVVTVTDAGSTRPPIRPDEPPLVSGPIAPTPIRPGTTPIRPLTDAPIRPR
jgi:hypothetical protein